MSERLGSRDLAVLAGESPSAPRHIATVEIFEPGDSGFDYARLVELVGDRITFVPRYRQRIAAVPGRLANPVWVDDPDFDLGYHVRRSALPRPGTPDQLFELVARIISRPLDRHRPLWEVYFIEGLAGGRVAMLSKSHEVLVDGVHTVDLAQVLLDRTPEPRPLHHDGWRPLAAPSSTGLVAGALQDAVADPASVLASVRASVDSALRTADAFASRASEIAGALSNRRPAGEHPLGGRLSQQRRLVTVRTALADYQEVREEHGGTVNDVILATVTGALRGWLLGRSESMSGLRHVRTVVPVSVSDRDLETTSLGSPIIAYFVDLPVGETSPVVRLHQVSYAFQAHKETGRGVAANRLAGIAGFAPSTFHAIGARVAADELRRGFQLSVTNVPGPQSPLYAAGARMVETYPVHPLLPGHALAIGVTSYDGHVYYGITADRDQVPDADVLGQCVPEALAELLDTIGGRARAPRGRRARKTSKRTTRQGR
jgi:diacylglycerol O-acyltransferase / wax synthase